MYNVSSNKGKAVKDVRKENREASREKGSKQTGIGGKGGRKEEKKTERYEPKVVQGSSL